MSFGFTFTPSSGSYPLLVNFSGISDGRDSPTYTWDFGDGGSGTGITTSHSYASPGTYYPALILGPSGQSEIFSHTFDIFDDFWKNADDSGLLYNSVEWSFRDGEGVLLTKNNNDVFIKSNISGFWRLTAYTYIDHSENTSLHLYMSGVSHYVDFSYYNDEIVASHDEVDVSTSGFSSGNYIGLRMVHQPSGEPYHITVDDSLESYFSDVDDGNPGPDGNVTDKWLQHRIRITSSGVYLGSDVGNPGTIVDHIFADSTSYTGYYSADNFNAVDLYIPHCPCSNSIWIDDIYVQSSGVTVASGTWDDGTYQGWESINGSYSGELAIDPSSETDVALTTVSGEEPLAITKSFDTITRSSGEITVLYKTYFPGSGYESHATAWTERRQIFVRLHGDEGEGIQASYRPLNYIKDQTNTPDHRLWVINYFPGGAGGMSWWIYNEGGVAWELLHSGNYSMDNNVSFAMNTGNGQGIRSILLESDYGLPSGGFPYGDYDTWFYDDFELSSYSGLLNNTFWSGIYVDLSGSAFEGSSWDTNDQLSDVFSGEFDLVSKIYSNDNTQDHGWRIIDNDATGNFLAIEFASGPSNALGATYHYDDPNESSVYIEGSEGQAPWSWWGKISKRVGDGNQTLSFYWASGHLQQPSGSDWMIFSSGSLTAEWTVPTGTFDTVYIAPTSGPDGDFGFTSLSLDSYESELQTSGIVEVFDIEISITGTLCGIGSIFSNFSYIPGVYNPPPAGSSIRTVVPILSNKRTSPYYAGSSADYLQARFELYNKHRLSYESNIPVELWLNYTTSWQSYVSGVTNRYGIVHFGYPCTNIPDIDCCLGVAKVTYKGKIYNSNIVRFNFIEGADVTYEIDAGSCFTPPNDRSGYDIFDADGRDDLIIDRMYGGS